MPDFFLSLFRESAQQDECVEAKGVFSALWPVSGSPIVEGNAHTDPGGATFLQGRCNVRAAGAPASWLRFVLSRTCPDGSEALLVAPITVDQDLALFRLDTVTFPAGANAWRHVHPGPGIRHLLQGELSLEADDHTAVMTAGDSWFEAANSPVQATASPAFPKSGFVRCMVLPVSYQDAPSIQILNETDMAKPRLQVTHRHLDQVVRLPSG